MRKEISFSESEAYTLRSITLNLEAVEQEPFATGWARVQDDLFGYIFSLTANREVCRPKFTLEIQQFWMHRDLGAEKIRLQLEGYEPLRPDFLIETKKVEDFDHANEICALANFFIFKVENATLVSNAKSLKELELYDQWDLSDAPDYPHDFGGDKFTDEDNMRLIAEKGLRIIAWDDETVLTLDLKEKLVPRSLVFVWSADTEKLVPMKRSLVSVWLADNYRKMDYKTVETILKEKYGFFEV